MELNISKTEEQSVAGEMKKAGGNPLLDLLNPVRESNYVPHQLLKNKKQRKKELRT